MVAGSLRRSLRWVLAIDGVLGLLCSVSMVLVTQAEFGRSTAAMRITDGLPSWALLSAAPPAPLTMLILGSLCALLLVVGRWPIKVCAALAIAWFAYAQAAFGPGSHWARQMEQNFDFTPLRVAALESVIALVAVSVLALVMAARPPDVVRSPLADQAPPPLP
jgi:hypothetical protein